MAHRDDREALSAKVDSLQRELAQVRAEQERERSRDPQKSRPTQGSGALAPLVRRAMSLWTAMTATPAEWSTWRAWTFGALAALVLGGTLLTMLVWSAAAEGHPDLTPVDIAVIALGFGGPPIVLGLAALLLRAPGNALWTAAGALGVIVFAVLIAGGLPAVRDAPRLMLLGRTQGSVETVGATPGVAWAEISPAYVWLDRMGIASTTVTRDGREETTSSAAVPIVPAIPWAGPTSLFACGDENWLRLMGSGSGTLGGRLETAVGLDLEAIQRTGVAVGQEPRCVTTTLGGANTTIGLGLLWMTLWLAVFGLGGARALMMIAAT